jgi:GntR family transcriptional regulator, trigonelline degradation regulator
MAAQALYEVRESLEGLAVRLFTERATEKEVVALQAALDRLAAAFDQGEIRAIVGEATHFYDVLLEGCGNATIRDLIRSLQARVVFLRGTSMSRPGRALGSLAEMRAIVDAILRRDSEAAEQAAKAHVRFARDAAMTVLEAEAAA